MHNLLFLAQLFAHFAHFAHFVQCIAEYRAEHNVWKLCLFFAFNSLSASACKGLDGLFVCLFVFVSYMLSIYRTATTPSEKFLHIFVCFVFYFVYNEFPS